jgi:hypothetical protein
MQGDKFKYYCKNKAGLYYYIDNLDSVQLSVTKRELPEAPDKWKEIAASLINKVKYKSNHVNISTPFEFVGLNKKILDYIAIYEGQQGYLYFEIEKQVPDNFSYAPLFSGKLDFKTYSYGEFGSTCTINDNDFLEILSSKEDVVLDIPLTPANSVDILMDGINLHYPTEYLVGNGDNPLFGTHTVELIQVANENQYASETERIKFELPANPNLGLTNQYFYSAGVNATVNIKFDFTVRVYWGSVIQPIPPAISLNYLIWKRLTNGTMISVINIYSQSSIINVFGVNSKVHHVQGDVNINVLAGERLYFWGFGNGANGANDFMGFEYFGTTMEFRLDTIQRSPATIHKAIRPHVLWGEIVNRVTNGEYTGVSPFLQQSTNILIPGTSLRKDAVVSVQTTVKEFLQYCYVNEFAVIKDIGTNTATIDNFKDTYLNQMSVNLGRVRDFTWDFSKQHTISSVKVGYNNIDFGVDGQINGKSCVHQTSWFTTGILNEKAEYDIVSPYIASPYAHELLRVKFGLKGTTDNKGDNKLYVVDSLFDVGNSRYYPNRPVYATLTGIIDPQYIYNLRITPKELVLKHIQIISSGVFNQSSNAALDILKFESTDKNGLLVKSLDNINFVRENSNESLALLTQPIYLPIVFKFITDYDTEIFTYLQGIRKYQYISFEWSDHTYHGFVIDILSNPDNNEEKTWKLLATVSSNLVNLL